MAGVAAEGDAAFDEGDARATAFVGQRQTRQPAGEAPAHDDEAGAGHDVSRPWCLIPGSNAPEANAVTGKWRRAGAM